MRDYSISTTALALTALAITALNLVITLVQVHVHSQGEIYPVIQMYIQQEKVLDAAVYANKVHRIAQSSKS